MTGWRSPTNDDRIRIDFWKRAILERCPFPAPNRLRLSIEAADVIDCCGCGCNSFNLRPDPSAPGISSSSGHGGMVFEADFRDRNSDKTIQILLFCNDAGQLNSIEVDCCGNAFPVPDVVDLTDEPIHVYSSATLLPDLT